MNLLDAIDWHEFLPLLRTAGRVIVILLLAALMMSVSRRIIQRVRLAMQRHAHTAEQAKRIDTIGRVFRYVAAVVIGLIATMLVLSEVGISIAPILGAAGVVGVAVGFGAQSLVKDFFSGFFILLENQVRVGDVVEVAGKSGLVEEITLRYVRMRDFDGNVHFVPNGEITIVSNFTLDFAYSVVDVGVAYRENIDEALEVMREVGAELRRDPAFAARILSDIEVVGVERLAESAIVLRCRFKVLPIEQWNVRREYFRRIKAAFDRAGIDIAFPHLTLYAGADKAGEAPPFHLSLRRAPRRAAQATATH